MYTQTTATTSTAAPPTSTPTTTTDPIIPATRGKFYSYHTEFSLERPLGYLMDCKANKGRSITDNEDHAAEHNLTFIFDNGVIRVYSPLDPESEALLVDINEAGELSETYFATTDLTEAEFEAMRQEKNGRALADFCTAAIAHAERAFVTLTLGVIVVVATESGKYGLLRVTAITPTSVAVDACHILL